MRKLSIFVLLLALSCKDKPTEPPPPPTPDMVGIWQGSGTKNGIAYTITVNLTEANKVVSGSGNIKTIFTTINFTVVGANVYPDVAFTFANADSTLTGAFAGVFNDTDDNIVDGAASVPAFSIVDEPLTIKRIGK